MLCPEYIDRLINNDVLPEVDKLRKLAKDRTEWNTKTVSGCKSKLFVGE